MSRRTRPLFLARDSYRRRRRIDAVRILPFLGGFLFLLPVLWRIGDAKAAPPTAAGAVYLFVIWALLILAAGILSRGLREPPAEAGTGQDE